MNLRNNYAQDNWRQTRQRAQQLGISHLFLPDHCQDVLHALGSPQEVEHSEVDHHALAGKHRTNVTRNMVLQAEYIPASVTRRHLHIHTWQTLHPSLQDGAKKRGHPISLQIFWKFHDRIACVMLKYICIMWINDSSCVFTTARWTF